MYIKDYCLTYGKNKKKNLKPQETSHLKIDNKYSHIPENKASHANQQLKYLYFITSQFASDHHAF